MTSEFNKRLKRIEAYAKQQELEPDWMPLVSINPDDLYWLIAELRKPKSQVTEDISDCFLRTQDIIEQLHKRIRELKSNTQFTKKELEKLKRQNKYEYKLLNIKIGHPDFGLVEPFTDLITAISYVQRSYENAKYEMLKSFRAIRAYSSKDGKNIALIFRHLTGGHVVKYNENDRVLLKQILESHVKRTHRSYKRRTGEM